MVDQPEVREERIDFRRYLSFLWKGKWIILVACLGTAVSAWVGSLLTTPIYEGVTNVQIDEDPAALKGTPSITRSLDTQIEIIKSRTTIEDAVRHINFHVAVEDAPSPTRFTISPIEAEAGIRTGVFKVVFEDPQGNFRLLNAAGQAVGRGGPTVPFKGGGLSFTISDVTASPGESFAIRVQDFDAVVQQVQANMRTGNIRGTNLLQIIYANPSPRQAAQVANAIADAYIKRYLAAKTEIARGTREFIGKHLGVAREELFKSEDAQREFQLSHKLDILPDEKTKKVLVKLSGVEAEKARVELELKDAEAVAKSIREGEPVTGNLTLASSSIIGRNRLFETLLQQIYQMEIRRGTLRGFTERYGPRATLDAQIQVARAVVLKELDGTINALRTQRDVLEATIRQEEQSLKSLSQDELNFVGLLRTAKINESVFNYLFQRYQEARVSEVSQMGNIRVIDPAIPPTIPVRPDTKQNILLGLVLGSILGVCGALIREFSDTALLREEVEKVSGLPVIGTVPDMDGLRRGWALFGRRPAPARTDTIVVHLKPESLIAEIYRGMRTRLHFATMGGSLKCLLMTSAQPHEGKSITVANLAATMGQTGRRILVVDADLRLGQMHLVFNCPRAPGLADVVVGSATVRQAILQTHVENVAVLPAGTKPPNPVELLESERMAQVLAEVREAFDLILVDTPAALLLADASVLAAKADGVVLVVNPQVSTLKTFLQGKAAMNVASARIVGIVMNQVPREEFLQHYGGARGYGRYYVGDGRGHGNIERLKEVLGKLRGGNDAE